MKPGSLFFKISRKSKFFNKIYIYYNIYIRNIKFLFRSSQFDEDLKILKFFKEKGFYVDIGCYHPIRYSNTYRMFKLGWKGMNIDLNPLSIEFFMLPFLPPPHKNNCFKTALLINNLSPHLP